jgi:hypothetical protein
VEKKGAEAFFASGERVKRRERRGEERWGAGGWEGRKGIKI